MSAQSVSAAELLLAVDAGGTKTSACLAKHGGANRFEVLGRGRTTGANPLTVGVDQAAEVIAAAVELARQDAKLPSTVVARAVLSIAGAADPAIARQLIDRLRAHGVAARIAIVSDVLPILACCSEQGAGIALIAGTGSVAVGRSSDGQIIRCGGWGYLLGDDGSGYAIGRAAIRLTLENLESVSAESDALSRRVLQVLQVADRAELTKTIYNSSNPRVTIAALAVEVAQLAAAEDPAARRILDDAGRDLACLVARTAQQLKLDKRDLPLAMAGGVLVGSEYLREAVTRNLTELDWASRVQVVADPLDGCLRLAVLEIGDDLVVWD
jgi:glucosamine kinase